MAPVLSAGPRDRDDVAARVLVRFGLQRRAGRRATMLGCWRTCVGRTEPSTSAGDTDVGERHLAAKLDGPAAGDGRACGGRTSPTASAVTTGPVGAPVVPSRPLGTSIANTGMPDTLTAAIASAAGPVIATREARAKQPVDDEVAVADRRRCGRLARTEPARRHARRHRP